MKDVCLIYDTSCFYEITILNYFLKATECDIVFCSLDGKAVTTAEGYSVNADMALREVDFEQVRSFILPGGDISKINNDFTREYLQKLSEKNRVIAGICAGVDLLDEAGVLEGIKSTHSTDLDFVRDNHVITSRANAYVDFAIEVSKELNLFVSEEDLEETINFWKYFKRVE